MNLFFFLKTLLGKKPDSLKNKTSITIIMQTLLKIELEEHLFLISLSAIGLGLILLSVALQIG